MVMIRLPVREQLAALILLAVLIGVSVISIATWVTVHNFVLALRSQRLGFVASLKAAQLSANLAILQHSCQCIASRIVIGETLRLYNSRTNGEPTDWSIAAIDLQAAIDSSVPNGGRLAVQGMVYSRAENGANGQYGVLNVTLSEIVGEVMLPYQAPNGSDVFLGDPGLGYPTSLYPNITFVQSATGDSVASYNGNPLPTADAAIVLGPFLVNSTLSLISTTVPIRNVTGSRELLGWITVMFDAAIITDLLNSSAALDETAAALLVGPANNTNRFPPGVAYYDETQPSQAAIDRQEVRYVFPLATNLSERHPDRVVGTPNPPFAMSAYGAAQTVFSEDTGAINNAHGNVYDRNEANLKISTGAALVEFPSVDWAIIVEESRDQVWRPIHNLRRVMVVCVCATIAVFIVIVWPLAHFVSTPIRQLRSATMKSVMPPGYGDYDPDSDRDSATHSPRSDVDVDHTLARKEGFFGLAMVVPWKKREPQTVSERNEEARRRQFRIPGKVPVRRHLVQDELTDLTSVYNEMSDELMLQYESLEDRVRQRTAELELSKKAAEAANESKTLFIANISHELKTPLNGILGMCAVCMQEDDPVRLKRSLGIIYKSGDLLLNLLTDLLTFSKNEVGQQLTLDEKDFRLRDISSQILAIFDKQAREGSIDLQFHYEERPTEAVNVDPTDASQVTRDRMQNMMLWGDTHRILQVIINLVSNSLKFTPPGGSVKVSVRCLGDAPEPVSGMRSGSMSSKQSRRLSSRKRGSEVSFVPSKGPDPVQGKSGSLVRVSEIERSAPVPPGRSLMFEFAVVDTGPGIPDELHERIFEPFMQGDLGLSKKYGGTGLGLSICSQLAGLMKGKMGIQSEVGKGSRFSMAIPLHHILSRTDSNASSSIDLRQSLDDEISFATGDSLKAAGTGTSGSAQPSGPPEDRPRLVGLRHPFFASTEPLGTPSSQTGAIEQITATATSSGRIRVLVAEDNKINQEVVLRMLKLEDIYDVTVAKDGQEALDLVKESMTATGKGPFNLIFMDVQMPNLDGLQSTRLIRESGYEAPIVALTAFAEESNVRDCLESGMNHFLSKPIKRPALKKVLNQYCAPILELDETTPLSGKSFGAEAMAATRANLGVSPRGSTSSLVPAGRSQSADPAVDRRPSLVDLANAQRPNSTIVVVSRPTSTDGGRPAS